MARILELDPVMVVDEPDSWRRAVRLAAAQEASEDQAAQKRDIEARSRSRKR